MKITCDVCGGELVIGAGGKTADCTVCGMAHSMERVREKLKEVQGSGQVVSPPVEEVCPKPVVEPVVDIEEEEEIYEAIVEEVYDEIVVSEQVVQTEETESEEKEPADGDVSREEEFLIISTNQYNEFGDEDRIAIEYTGTASTVIPPEDVFIFGDIESRKSVFRYPDRLKKFIFNEYCHDVGEYAFAGCCNLEELYIPENIQAIWCTYNTFSHQDDPKEYSNCHVFQGCTGLKRVVFHPNAGLDGTMYSIFKGCSSLNHIELPQTLDCIGISMFQDCVSLEEIVIPESVTVIAQNAFRNCYNLKRVHLPSHPVAIHRTAFMGTQFTPPPEYLKVNLNKCPVCGGKINTYNQCKKCQRMVHYGYKDQW